MNYKDIIKSPVLREKILDCLRWIPDKQMLQLQYRIKTGRKLNLNNPTRFTEKIQWYKLYYRNELMPKCVDKYTVREYVESKDLGGILNELYGVYEQAEDIDFAKLPDQFVIKKTNGGGGLNVIICRDKSKLDMPETVKKITEWLRPSKAHNLGREWAYYGLQSRIVIERYLENREAPEAGITDYKFFCFNGEPLFVVVDVDRYIGHKRNFYDVDWTYLDVRSDCPNFGDTMPKPSGYEKMVEAARVLSEGFPFVRVDLYLIDEEVYFGELTFYPWSGYVDFSPDDMDFQFSKMFRLTE